MSTLLIDIGNTRIKVAYADQRIAFAHHSGENELLHWLNLHNIKPKAALGVCVASAVLMRQVEQLLFRIDCAITWLDGSTPCALLHNSYDEPQRLGADRWLALIGVLKAQQQANQRSIIHASFGTATTIDTLLPGAKNGSPACFKGGLILPGPQLMYDSLALNTAKLGNGIGELQNFPTHTRAAISSGIAGAQAGAVLRQWLLTWQSQQTAPLLVCSGGGWELIADEVKRAHTQQLQLLNLGLEPIIWQPTPVLDGLAYMAALLPKK